MQTYAGHSTSGAAAYDDDLLGGPTLVQRGRPDVPPSDEGVVPHPPGMDWVLLGAVVTLSILGVVMAFSASYFEAVNKHKDELFFLSRHLRYAAIAVVALCVGVWTPYQLWRRLAPGLLVAAVVLLTMVLLLGDKRYGARRWLWGFQPVELAKLAFIVVMARSIVSKAERGVLTSVVRGFLPLAMVFLLFAGLLMKQPDMGSTMVFSVLLLGMAFVGGMRVGPILGAGVTVVGTAMGFIYFFSPWRWKRILAFLDPFAKAAWNGKGYQLANSIMAVTQGGTLGQGLGASQQKLGFLPEAHTDFVLAIIAEELGVVGVSFVAFLFWVILWRGMGIIAGARDEFGRLVAFGILLLLGTQASVNFGVVVGLLPTKGLTLPFVSFGGTSLIAMSLAVGILLNVGRGGQVDADAWFDRLRLPRLPTRLFDRHRGPRNVRAS